MHLVRPGSRLPQVHPGAQRSRLTFPWQGWHRDPQTICDNNMRQLSPKGRGRNPPMYACEPRSREAGPGEVSVCSGCSWHELSLAGIMGAGLGPGAQHWSSLTWRCGRKRRRSSRRPYIKPTAILPGSGLSALALALAHSELQPRGKRPFWKWAWSQSCCYD